MRLSGISSVPGKSGLVAMGSSKTALRSETVALTVLEVGVSDG